MAFIGSNSYHIKKEFNSFFSFYSFATKRIRIIKELKLFQKIAKMFYNLKPFSLFKTDTVC
ncbi:hypothetical protein RBB68_15330 [Leptospira interrogans]|uniref:Uncharacterized protein n=14 Tax=Leptospira TaxID=171 RepID=A0AAP9WGL5_LEPIR|nr:MULTISPECIES: hypothetical protein [Leptospira]EMG12923.1 hypothetical protein LEP1GSC151_3702 [Leptospira interrogans serovar Grippotyphosa str. LT2186]EMM84174.1 hypothetical protein LEP1GSC037_3072 [Leptospira interrogans str. 2006001854]EMM93153.1 hypothetical protein LEP1GSC158_5274 [Leptospira interrogans serovar Zanoni str. LT2156]EMN31880.1 hypothetical protein LEP1GSC083_4563 [Leptospira interrogans serovar Pyrogenes str. L0374]EMN47235.1 hypothetical protein LEP1GSC088_4725 [Lepto